MNCWKTNILQKKYNVNQQLCMVKFNFNDLVNNYNNSGTIIRRIKDCVLYRIHHISLNKDYIGTTRSIKSRIWGKWGYIRKVELKNEISPIHKAIIDYGYKDFDIYIEEVNNDIIYIESLEEIYITKFNSFINGYNETPNGKGGKFNTTWITNGIESKRINLDKYPLPDGWKIGHEYLTNRDKILVNNGVKQIFISKEEKDRYLKEGYNIGSLTKPVLGKIKINNGEICRYHDKCKPIPEGFKIGGLPKDPLYYLNNGIINIRVKISEIESKIKEGWKRGRINTRK